MAEVGKPSLTADFKASLPVVKWNQYQVGGGQNSGTPTGPVVTDKVSGGCQAGPVAGSSGAVALLGLGVGLLRWRRRQR
jgi:uncharacterized protein (TIGR03382 family)